MKGTTKAKRLPADLQTAVDTQFQRSREDLTSTIILTSAAKNAPSMAALFRQTKAIKELQVSHTKNHTPA